MQLLERAAEIRAELRRQAEVRAAGSQAEVFRSRAAQFKPLAHDLNAELARSQALQAAGLKTTRPAPRPHLRTRALDLLTRFEADPKSLAQADETVRFEFTQGVRKANDEFRALNSDAWARHVAERSDAPSEEVLRALETVASYRIVVQRLRKAVAALAALRAQAPTASDVGSTLQAVEAARQEKDAVLGMLKGSDVPAEVLTFLRNSGLGGAALGDLTPSVINWLGERSLLVAFRIVPAIRNT